jgi:hypothetical protein
MSGTWPTRSSEDRLTCRTLSSACSSSRVPWPTQVYSFPLPYLQACTNKLPVVELLLRLPHPARSLAKTLDHKVPYDHSTLAARSNPSERVKDLKLRVHHLDKAQCRLYHRDNKLYQAFLAAQWVLPFLNPALGNRGTLLRKPRQLRTDSLLSSISRIGALLKEMSLSHSCCKVSSMKEPSLPSGELFKLSIII